MGFLDELKKLTRPYAEDEDDEFDSYDDEYDEEPAPAEDPVPATRPGRGYAEKPVPASDRRATRSSTSTPPPRCRWCW